MAPAKKNLLPWYEAAAEVLFSQYLGGLQLVGAPSDQLLKEVSDLVVTRLSGLKLSSQSTYRSSWNRWAVYARSRGMHVLPVTEIGVLAWMRHDLCYTVQAIAECDWCDGVEDHVPPELEFHEGCPRHVH